MRQGLRLEPLLQAISDFLDDQKDMIEQVRCDLTRGLKKAETGRSGLTPQQILRSLVLMRIKNWDYRELRERIADGCTLRQFTDFYCLPVPRHDAFHRGFTRLTPETLKAINDLVVHAAVDLELEDGQKRRVDTTVVQTDIHHPTDNTLLWDVVRVVTRLVGRLAKAVERRRIKGVCDPPGGARRRMRAIQRMTTTQRHHQQRGKYRELIGIAEEVIESARTALRQTRKARGKDMITDLANGGDTQGDRALLWLGSPCDRSVAPPRSQRRTSSNCREDLFDFRASYRPHQARQSADADRVRPQGLPRRKRARLDHTV